MSVKIKSDKVATYGFVLFELITILVFMVNLFGHPGYAYKVLDLSFFVLVITVIFY